MKSFLLLVALICFNTFSFGQTTLPVLKSTVDSITIQDGNELSIGNWFLAFDLHPDLYTSNKLGEFVTFYSDLDSMRFQIHEDSVYDFVIVKGQDSAFTQVKYAPTYLDILKTGKGYDLEEAIQIPTFTYQEATDEHLQALRVGFHLDSIAGSGDEVSRIVNVLHWIHDLIPHDGNHGNPSVKNAMSLINECQKGERGLNCRGLAIVLNECYLSLGIKSRFVTCMPKDSIFDDCHVINMVYVDSLEKWIWIDPTNNAYVMDENGVLLSIEEVRVRLIEDLPLFINEDANWNNRFPTDISFYLYEYMAKNLYRMECPLRSEYNLETRKRKKKIEYVELLPMDGLAQNPRTLTTKSSFKNKSMTVTKYKTNNPDNFWVKP